MKLSQLLVVAGLAVVFIFGFNYYNDQSKSPDPIIELPPENQDSIEEDLEKILGREIADDVRKTEIFNDNARAIVTIDDQNMLSIIADLPSKDIINNFSASIKTGEEEISLGEFTSVKGGYIIERKVDLEMLNSPILEITTGEDTILQGILNL